MDAFQDLEPLRVDGKPALDQCFVDIPECLEMTSENLDPLSRETEADVDVDSLLQPDYSGFTFWSSDSAKAETKGAAEIWRTGAGIFLPAASSEQTFLSSLTRRLSVESLQTSVDSRHVPFKSGYIESEPELFSSMTQQEEFMHFVPSTVSAADGSQKLKEESEKPVKVSRRKRQFGAENLSPPRLKKLKVRSNADKLGKEEVSISTGSSSRRKGAEVSSAVSHASRRGDRLEPVPETTTSSVLHDPTALRTENASTGDSFETNKVPFRETVLRQSSPNLLRGRADNPVQSEELDKPSRNRKKKIFADESGFETGSINSEKKGRAIIKQEIQNPVGKPKKEQRPGRPGKVQKRSVRPLSDVSQRTGRYANQSIISCSFDKLFLEAFGFLSRNRSAFYTGLIGTE